MGIFLAKILRKLKIIQNGYLSFLNFTWRVKIHNKSFKIPIINNIGWSNVFDSEHWMLDIIYILCKNKFNLFIDVGTNIGQTLIKYKKVTHNNNYIGFEPNPNCFFYLNKLIHINRLNHCSIIPVGLSDKSCIKNLYFYYNNPADATATTIERLRPENKIMEKKSIATFRLDELDLNISKENLILKIDVEGAELEVLKGAFNTIKKYTPFILIEILPAYNTSNRIRIRRQNEIKKMVDNLNYSIYQIQKKKNNKFKNILKINKFPIDSNIYLRDYLLIPKNKESIIHDFELTKEKM